MLYLRDALFLFSPYLVLCSLQQDKHDSTGIGTISLFGLILLAAISLVKLTFAIASISILCLSLFLPGKAWQRVAPIVLYLLCLMLLWVFSGQQPADLHAYFVEAIPIVSGYTDAMSLDGSLLPVVLFVVGAVIAFLISVAARRSVEALAMLMTLFFSFKAAYVRQDIHEVIAAGTLMLISLWHVGRKPDVRTMGLVLISLVLCCYSIRVQANLGPRQLAETWARHAEESLLGVIALASDPHSFEKRFRRDLKEIARQHPVKGKGSLDSYSYHQTAVIANGAVWNPRPVMQSYSAYTAALAEANATHLSQQTRPDRLLFHVEPIDGRFSSMDDGRSWPEIWSHYSLTGLTSAGLLFQAEDKRHMKYARVTHLRARLGDEVSIAERRGELVWVRVEMKKTLSGKLLGLLFRPPHLRIDVKDVSGRWVSYRYLASVGEGGFLLSPKVNDSREFEKLTRAIEQGEAAPYSVDAFRIAQSTSWIQAYEPEIAMELSTLEFEVRPEVGAAASMQTETAIQPQSPAAHRWP
ncbi:hypothetical protein [Cupriavidus sp. Agwp_2]|uniref:hypothetical protein n=1 Tax=Cupriavidus sp. Agwp_2 TaxID=2897324 RepID=UPI0011C172C6